MMLDGDYVERLLKSSNNPSAPHPISNIFGSESETRIKRFWVFNPDYDGTIEPRFRAMIGRGIENRFRFINEPFESAIPTIRAELLKG